jgi:hydroxymethylbilane synthase
VTTEAPLRLGTRGSQLALYQAHTVARLIAEAGGPACEIVIIKTSGDRLQEAPLSEVGGKRLFVKELEDALLSKQIDLAVHSSKDMPAVLPEGLAIAGVLPREDPLDAVVLPASHTWHGRSIGDLREALGDAPTIGTSSVRRIAQLTRLLPNARFVPIRGNLDTRLRKLDAGDYDALVLAAAGLRRLGFGHRISLSIPATLSVPAPGQGIIAIEMREDDDRVRRYASRVTDARAAVALTAERALVEALGGGCQTPIGALATPTDDDGLELMAAVISLDGGQMLLASGHGVSADAPALGARIASQLLEAGAAEILEDARRSQPAQGIQS